MTVEVVTLLGFLHGATDVGDAGKDGIDRDEVGLRRVGDDEGQRRLAGAGWAVEDERRQLVGLDRSSQQAAMSQDVILTDEFVEHARSQARRQRLIAGITPAGLEEVEGFSRRALATCVSH